MPLLVVYTNLPKASIPDDFVFGASSSVAKVLEKPNDVSFFIYLLAKYKLKMSTGNLYCEGRIVLSDIHG